MKNLLSISTDIKIFEKDSAVRSRQIKYAEKYNNVSIIILTKGNYSIQEFGNIKVYPTNSWSKIFCVFDAIRIGKKIFSDTSGVTSSDSWEITCQDPFECGFVGYRIKKPNQKIEFQIHTDLFSPYFTSIRLGYKLFIMNLIRQNIAKYLLPRADKVRVVSRRISNSLISRFEAIDSKIEIRPIAVEMDKIVNSPVIVNLHSKYTQFEKIVLMASRISLEKNIVFAIDAINEVIMKYPKTGLIIVGSGSEKINIKRRIERQKIGNNVIIEDWASPEILYSYYKTADLFLNTSFYEGYGLTLLEAKNAGCKIISTDVGIAKDIGAEIVEFNKDDLISKITENLYGSKR